MALAVAEAHRILRPGGAVLDIHPRAAPRRLEHWQSRTTAMPGTRAAGAFDAQTLGDLAPDMFMQDLLAASNTISVAQGFSMAATVNFEFQFFFDSLDDLTGYLEDNDELELASDALLEQALHALQRSSMPSLLVMEQPVVVNRLNKL